MTQPPVYDRDADGLIEVTTLEQLDAIRHDVDGDGLPTHAGKDAYRAAFPEAFLETGARLTCVGECRGYELTADLDFDTNGSGGPDAGDTYWNDGVGWVPIIDKSGRPHRRFEATFEGNGHTVRNLFINRPTSSGVGLFQGTDYASVIRHVRVTRINVTGNNSVGGLAGRNLGQITASYTTGRVTGQRDVGGLVGKNYGTITASYATGRVSGTRRVGGLVGGQLSGRVAASYATGRVSGTALVGGLVGRHSGTITASHATGRVTGQGNVGGLVGSSSPDEISYSYWDSLTSGHETGSNGQGQTTVQLQAPTASTGIYSNWSDDQWDFGEADEYPALSRGLPWGR